MKKTYINRVIEKEILGRSKEFPVIVLTGPRQTGKSTMLKHIFGSYNYCLLDDPLKRKIASGDPSLFLEKYKAPLIIDEIQYAPELLPYIKMAVDANRSKHGSYILTGSQLFPLMEGISESLAGRVVLYELLGFSFDEISQKLKKHHSYDDCFKLIFRGSFPEPSLGKVDLNSFFSSYLHTYLERDIRQIQSVHDLRLFQQFLELLAARVGGLLNISEVAKECGISHTTAQKWLSLLESTRIVYLLRSYHKNITKRVIKSHKLYFTDTGLLSYLLRYPDYRTLQNSSVAGQIFENLIIMEVLKYKFNHNKRFELYFYRDSNHNEVDLLLDFGSEIRLAEVKLAKSIRLDHWKTMVLVQKVFKSSRCYVLSMNEDRLSVAKNIESIPWWSVNEMLAA